MYSHRPALFGLFTFWRYIYIIFMEKKSRRIHYSAEIKVFKFFLLDDGRIRIRIRTTDQRIRICEA